MIKITKQSLKVSQKGISSLLILGVIGIMAAIAVVFFGLTSVKTPSSTGNPAASPSPSLSSKEASSSYDLVKEEFDLDEKQLEILSRVRDNDNNL